MGFELRREARPPLGFGLGTRGGLGVEPARLSKTHGRPKKRGGADASRRSPKTRSCSGGPQRESSRPVPIARITPTLLLAALGLASAFTGTPVQAQSKLRGSEKEPMRAPPPQAVPLTVQVRRGESATFNLRIYGQQREILTFLIREKPQSGRLSEPVSAGREQATVTYEAPADAGIARDWFSYAVRNSAGVSAASAVVITITDEPAILAMPAGLEFLPTLAGTSTEQEFALSNTGGGMIEGRMEVPAPWRLAGKQDYRLPAGEQQKFKLVFAPGAAGVSRGEVRFSSHPDRALSLEGTAHAPLEVVPGNVVLRQTSPNDTGRGGTVELRNHTASPQAITFQLPSRLLPMPPLTIPAGESGSARFEMEPSDLAAFQEAVVIAGAGILVQVPVAAPAVPALLRSDRAEITYGRLRAGAPLPAESVLLTNAGAGAGTWRLVWPLPWRGEQTTIRLAPGESTSLTPALVSGTVAGMYRGTLRAEGEYQKVEITLNAEIDAPPARAVAVSAERPARRTAAVQNVAPPASAPEAATRKLPDPGPQMRHLPEARVSGVTSSEATVRWPVSANAAANFRCELRQISLDAQRKLQVTWAEHPQTEFARDGDQWVARLRRLAPGFPHVVRIRPIANRRDLGSPIFAVYLTTLPKKPWGGITPLGVLIPASVICIGLIAWRRYRERG